MTNDDHAPAPSDRDLFDASEVDRLRRATIVDADGEKIGNVEQLYLHDSTGRPSWASMRVGLFRTRSTLVPLDGVDLTGDKIRVPFSRDVVKDAPKVDVDDHISTGEEGELHAYYRGHGWAGPGESSAQVGGTDTDRDSLDDSSAHRQEADTDPSFRSPVFPDGADDSSRASEPHGPTTPPASPYATAPVDELGDDQAPAEFVTSGDTESSADATEAVEHVDSIDDPAQAETSDDSPAFAGGAAGSVPDAVGDTYTEPARAQDHADATPRSIGIDDTDPDAPLPGVHHETPEVEEFASQSASESGVPPAAVAPGSHDGQFPGDARADGSGGRRVSDYDEVRDGGYGIGSAAPIDDGAQPLGHALRAWEDTRSYRGGAEADWEREPDVWFMDETAAQNAGFHPAD